MYINTSVLVTVLSIVLTGIIGLVTWLVKQSNEHAKYLAAVAVILDNLEKSTVDHSERLHELETHTGRFRDVSH